MNQKYDKKNKAREINISISPVVFGITALMASLIIAVSWYSFGLGQKINTRYYPLVDAAMEIKLEATTAHLWLEEIISGDRHQKLFTVLQHLEKANWYAKAMLEGGSNEEGHFIALDDAMLRTSILEVLTKLTELKAITIQRHRNIASSAPGSALDQQYDAIFESYITQADQVESRLQEIIRDDLNHHHWLQKLLITTIVISSCLILFILFRHEQQRINQLLTLQHSLREIKTLSGLLPICSSCKKVRDDGGYWNKIENYISDHSEAQFSHGICPGCKEELYGERLRKK